MSKKIVLRILLFVFTIVILDLLFGWVLDKMYFQQEKGLYYRTTYSMDSTEAEVLIFGASTANHHYNPQIFEDEMGFSCYNTGRDGQGVFYFLAIQEVILTRYTPKVIVLDINGSGLSYNKQDYDRLTSLLPYYKKNEKVKEIVNLRGDYQKIKNISRMYPYNSMILTIIKNIYTSSKNKNETGFKPLYKSMGNQKLDSIPFSTKAVDTLKVRAFSQFIDNCIARDIELFIIRSPYYSLNSVDNASWKEMKTIIINKRVKLLNYSNVDSIIDYSNINIGEIMADPGHLNDIGAEYFSRMIAKEIYKGTIRGNNIKN